MNAVDAALARLNEFIIGPRQGAKRHELATAPARLILQAIEAAERTRIAQLVDLYFDLDPERGEVDQYDLKAWIGDKLTVAQVREKLEALRARRARGARRTWY